jgi:hypothetical protein
MLADKGECSSDGYLMSIQTAQAEVAQIARLMQIASTHGHGGE